MEFYSIKQGFFVRLSYRMLLVVSVFFVFLLSSISYASVDSGIVWLNQQQQQDGSFYTANSLATPYQSTVETLNTLNHAGTLGASSKAMAIAYLKIQPKEHIEDLSRWISLATITGESVVLDTQNIAAYRTAVGAYGDYRGYEPSVLATLSALKISTALPAIEQATNYLKSVQQQDFGWAEQGNLSAVYVTAAVSQSLQPYRFTLNIGSTIANATQYLLNHQNAAGDWGSDLDTAIALLAVIPVTLDSSKYQRALNTLRAAQLTNGSWGNDVFTTALALQVLQLAQNINSNVDAKQGVISGAVLSENTGLPIAGASVSIQSVPNGFAQTTRDGRYTLNNLSAGQYNINYSAPGFQSVERVVILQAGERADLGRINLVMKPNVALVVGQVTDSVSQNPISGVSVQFSGAITTSVVTDTNGRYALEVPAGALTIAIAHAGYNNVNVPATTAIGNQLNFSPALVPVGQPTVNQASIRGVLIDADTKKPVANAIVRLLDNSKTTQSNNAGEFTLTDIPTGSVKIIIEATDYQSIGIDALAVSGNIIDAGILSLIAKPAAQNTMLGIITDADTGKTIAGALIVVGNVTATSAIDGAYTLSGIADKTFSVKVSAAGYQPITFNVSTANFSTVRMDIPLKKTIAASISIESFTVEQPLYDAYSTVNFLSTIANTSNDKTRLSVQAQIFNQSGALVQELNIADGKISLGSALLVESGEHKPVAFSWGVLSVAPGKYRVVLSIYENGSTQLLDQREAQFDVAATKHVASIRLTSDINHASVGATLPVNFQVAIRNQSNVPVPLDISYQLVDPVNVIAYSGNASLVIDPTKLFLNIPVGSVPYQFTQSGTYKLKIQVNNGVLVDLVEEGEINIAPNISIDMTQEINPEKIAPSSSERVRVKIRVKGVEVQ